jgi:hypothetical protein
MLLLLDLKHAWRKISVESCGQVAFEIYRGDEVPVSATEFQAVHQPFAGSGLNRYAIRLLPNHIDSVSPFLRGLIKWARASSPAAELQTR